MKSIQFLPLLLATLALAPSARGDSGAPSSAPSGEHSCGYPNAGDCDCCKCKAGSNKFSVNTSQVLRGITDLRHFGGGSWAPLEFVRNYGSRYKYGAGHFGQAKHFTHSHQWTVHYVGQLWVPGGAFVHARRIVSPSGTDEIYYETSDTMLFNGVVHTVSRPRVARSNLLLRNGVFFTLLETGGAHTVFERITLPGGSVRYDLVSVVDSTGNIFTYTSDSEGKVTKVADPAGKALHIYYKPMQTVVPQELHEITTTPPEAWVDVTPSDTTTEFKCLQVLSAEGGAVNLAEVEVFTQVPDGNGGLTEQKLTGTPPATITIPPGTK